MYPLKSVMAERLSILNDPPRVLDGPQLLHELICFERHNDACAIDFTRKEERRQYTYQEVSVMRLLGWWQRLRRPWPLMRAEKTNLLISTSFPLLLPQSTCSLHLPACRSSIWGSFLSYQPRYPKGTNQICCWRCFGQSGYHNLRV